MARHFDHRVLVTGGAGFIGSHLCTQLLHRGFEVLCLDNFHSGTRRNIAHVARHPRFDLIRHDVTEPLSIECDMVFHLACPAGPAHHLADPERTLTTCLLGTLNVLRLARRLKVPVVHASAGAVLGDTARPSSDAREGFVDPLSPRACHDEGKRCAETACVAFRRQHGVDVRIARIFDTYGPRMPPDEGRVVPTFIQQALANEPLTVHGDGQQARSLCYVDDVVDGLLRLMFAERPPDSPVNIGHPEELRIIDIAERVLELTGSAAGIARVPPPYPSAQRRCPDIALATEALGWRPQVPLSDGLQRTVGWFQRQKPAAAVAE